MRKLLYTLAVGLASAGCLSTTPLEVSDWPIDPAVAVARAPAPKFGAVRLVDVLVDAPYDTRSLPVLRANGSLAFDAYNRFAALPSQLLRPPARELLTASGLFKSVLPTSSVAPATIGVELEVSRFALDCRGATRTASVRLALRFVDRAKGEIAYVRGEGAVEASSGNYGEAFSAAFAAAFATALGQL